VGWSALTIGPFCGILLLLGCAAPQVKLDRLEEARKTLAKVDISKIATLTAAEGAAQPSLTKDEEERLTHAFNEMLHACRETLTGFESRSKRLQYARVAIATIGALAGGVILPALTTASALANAEWISALGGISGVSNAAQQSMSAEGLTASSVLRTRQSIIESWKQAAETYFNPKATYEERRTAVASALAACTLYSITVPEAAPANASGGR
jgi:hypothetical protein